ncbi:hypothetical protein A1Q2_01918 [Trichosporon asahii var. asahii CBS 8904]|uniref:Uncharacterized protein n=1 Tax=Trichosporon asahii var. asahii (strain CBS 8904) TaxID=1220162 RepID=K1VIE8_TRIAC|nr:hypothetical protein A1Q2_01918 [Trichosporon asahii var. asahii CBS 8904]
MTLHNDMGSLTLSSLPPLPSETDGATVEGAVTHVEVVDGRGFRNPVEGGGSMITRWLNPESLGEPLNLIVSGASDAEILVDQKLKGGFRNYMLSGYMSDEAFGLHLGDPQLADLGDGRGALKQVRELRHNYGEVLLGTLTETLIGGNHLRYWKQGGSNAYFLAASAEKNVQEHHDIVPDGYDLGRDQFVGKLVGYEIKGKPKAGDRFKGESHALGWTYETSVEYVDGLLAVDQATINHHDTVSVDGKTTDGLVALLTVRIKKRGIL